MTTVFMLVGGVEVIAAVMHPLQFGLPARHVVAETHAAERSRGRIDVVARSNRVADTGAVERIGMPGVGRRDSAVDPHFGLGIQLQLHTPMFRFAVTDIKAVGVLKNDIVFFHRKACGLDPKLLRLPANAEFETVDCFGLQISSGCTRSGFAMRAMQGRDQAFAAIWNQDYPAVMAKVICPMFVMSAEDDFFVPYLERVKEAHPETRIAVLGPAKVASPELGTDESVKVVREFLADVESA